MEEEFYKEIEKENFFKQIKSIQELISTEDLIQLFRACARLGKYLQDRFPQEDSAFILKQAVKNSNDYNVIENEKNLYFSKNLQEAIVDLYREYLSDADEVEEGEANQEKINKNLALQTTNTLQMSKLGIEYYLKFINTQLDKEEAPDRFNEVKFEEIRKKINEKIKTNSKLIREFIEKFNHYKNDIEFSNQNNDLIKQKLKIISEILLLLNNKKMTHIEIFQNLYFKIAEQGEILSSPLPKESHFYTSFFKPVLNKLKIFPLIDQWLKNEGELLVDKIRTLDRKSHSHS